MKDNYSIVLKENPTKDIEKKPEKPGFVWEINSLPRKISSDFVFILRINLYEWFILIIYLIVKYRRKKLYF